MGYKEQKATENNTQECEEENKMLEMMDKILNLDDLDKVAGGSGRRYKIRGRKRRRIRNRNRRYKKRNLYPRITIAM